MTSNTTTDSWERDWAARVVAAAANLEGDFAMTTFIDADTEVQFGNNPIVKGLDKAMSIIGVIYGHAASLRKEITRVHVDASSNTIYITYIVHITAKGDSQVKEFHLPTTMILVKPLGKQQQNIQRMEVYNDFSPFLEWAKKVGGLQEEIRM